MLADVKVLWSLARGAGRGATHAERLENFYAAQAADYDRFRERLLAGREGLYLRAGELALGVKENPLWIDLGGGTGWNVERIAPDVRRRCRAIKVVDLTPSLLRVARDRIEKNRWDNVEAVQADATTYCPDEGPADVVTFSYSLTMIPDYARAIEQAHSLLRVGGIVAVVDFHVSPRHSAFTRAFWPRWFRRDGVHLGPERLELLQRSFDGVHLHELTSSVPYLPCVRVPFFQFVGFKRNAASAEQGTLEAEQSRGS
jgi:S-adenosylmethionine-diacylgycerolhomoserine-N-methlytransferase